MKEMEEIKLDELDQVTGGITRMSSSVIGGLQNPGTGVKPTPIPGTTAMNPINKRDTM